MDITVALLPSENICAKAQTLTHVLSEELTQNGIGFSNVANSPHISLYQFRCREKKIDDICATITKSPAFDFEMDCSIERVGNNLFWSSKASKANKELNAFHHTLVEELKHFKDDVPLMQIADKQERLNPHQKELVKEFGVYWGIPGFFEPHITLIYNLQPCDQEQDEMISHIINSIHLDDMVCQSSKLIIGEIGYHGNVTRVISSK